MKREDLKSLGLTDEVIEKAGLEADVLDKIMALHGKDIEKHKAAVETAQGETKSVKEQLDEANKAIEGFKALKPDELQKAADEWKTKSADWEAKAKKASEDAEAKIAGMKFDYALDGALTGAKAKNLKAVKALLKIDDLKLSEDGSIVGLAEQLEKVKAENDYLFDSDEPDPKIVVGGKNKPEFGEPRLMAAREAAGLPIEKDK
jgi:hypothetical protein